MSWIAFVVGVSAIDRDARIPAGEETGREDSWYAEGVSSACACRIDIIDSATT